MKFKFWKRSLTTLIASIGLTIFLFVTIIAFSILIIFHRGIWPGLISIIIVFIIALVSLFRDLILAKIEISESGIKCKLFKKTISYMNWEDMIEIKDVNAGFNKLLAFQDEAEQITIELNKEKYEAIMQVCPREDLKDMLNNIEWFKRLHKND